MARRSRKLPYQPFEYVVYTDRPGYGGSYPCKVHTLRIPRGQHFSDVRDQLPPTVGRLALVTAYSAESARDYAAKVRGVRCAPSDLRGPLGIFYVEGKCPRGGRDYRTSSDFKLVRKHARTLQARGCAIVMGWKD